jgi:hypothetical protein
MVAVGIAWGKSAGFNNPKMPEIPTKLPGPVEWTKTFNAQL